ncbi:protein translocase subunit SecF, partial [Candidatus Woesebacteria bacterium CG_4_10_14_0_2_um_filter_39_14]
WFAVALLIGAISGTYSSPFNAVPLLVLWENLSQRRKK